MLFAFLAGTFAAALIGLPVDWVRRRSPGATAFGAGVINAIVLVAVVAGIGASGLLSDWMAVPALVFGLILGNVGADAVATRLWGPAPVRP
ncbi:hypothetical protein ACSVHC_00755 [Arthrobacter sp. KNU-44]|uniref:hypothetical protein n=1 Tax=Arthrobacter sp. KNU-44 TaxID=3450744 RepID=UPI003F43B98C